MKLEIMVWNSKQYVRNNIEYLLDSIIVRPECVQIFIRAEQKPTEQKPDEKPKTST